MTQNLVTLVGLLRPLLHDPESNWSKIVELLKSNNKLAEFEVARHLVQKNVQSTIEARLLHLDPSIRIEGLKMMGLCYGRSVATNILRKMIKDPNLKVREQCCKIIDELMISDVAIPHKKYSPRTSRIILPGGWNVTGWTFGVSINSNDLPKPAKTSPKKLKQAVFKLPQLNSISAALTLFEIPSTGALRRLCRPGVGVGAPYVSFEIPKASGAKRTITAPRKKLRQVQRIILKEILQRVPVHPAAQGFVRGRSTVTNASLHQQPLLIIKFDLHEFFPTVHYSRVVGLFEQLGYPIKTAKVLAKLTTHLRCSDSGSVYYPGVLPQGAPTSPAISNLVCRRLDSRLAGLAKQVGATYSRYADDMTFSFSQEPNNIGRILWWIDQICQQEGFAENIKKRRILRKGQKQAITGVVVNNGVHLPRIAKRTFRAVLSNCRNFGIESQSRGIPHFRSYLIGFASYAKMVQPEYGAKLLTEVRELLRSQPAKKSGVLFIVDGE